MIKRDLYLDKIKALKDTPDLVKAITGVRRSGKSSLLLLFREYLLNQKVPESSIVFINFEDFQYRNLLTAEALHTYLDDRLAKKGMTYLFLDEIQMVDGWEKVVNSLRLNSHCDIYVTGSNASLLSGQLATLLSGRYVAIRVFPLSYKEFLTFHNLHDSDKTESFNTYLNYGGMPGLKDIPPSVRLDYLSDLVNTIIVKDIATYAQIRDIDLLRKVIDFLASNIGKLSNPSNIADFLLSTGRKSSTETIDNYLMLLEGAFIFLRAGIFNLAGKKMMKTNAKFYSIDLGLRNSIIGASGYDYGSSLENIIYLELLRRGYKVTTGKYNEWEVDFVAGKEGKREYIQVSASIVDEKTLEREIRPLRAINDNYSKTILTMDKLPYPDFDGVKVVNIIDYLLE